MIDATFIQKILDISDVEVKEIDGRKYASRQLYQIKNPTIMPLYVSHLSGIVDYVKSKIDNEREEMFLHIASPNSVELLSFVDPIQKDRDVLVIANVDDNSSRILGQFKDQEMFLLDLNAGFVRTENIESLIEIVSNVRSEEVRIDEDDGVSQALTTRAGIARIANVKLPNPIVLQPWRTFAEIDQPEDYFVFRARKGSKEGLPTFGLFENGSKRWEIAAIDSIKRYYIENLPQIKIVG